MKASQQVDGVSLQSQIDALSAATAIPSGCIIAYGASSAPTGWLAGL
jgi:hypothetical protein